MIENNVQLHKNTLALLEKLEEETMDPVNFEDFVDPVLLTNCGHSLSQTMLNQILEINKLCPLCNKEITHSQQNFSLKSITQIIKDHRKNVKEEIESISKTIDVYEKTIKETAEKEKQEKEKLTSDINTQKNIIDQYLIENQWLKSEVETWENQKGDLESQIRKQNQQLDQLQFTSTRYQEQKQTWEKEKEELKRQIELMRQKQPSVEEKK